MKTIQYVVSTSTDSCPVVLDLSLLDQDDRLAVEALGPEEWHEIPMMGAPTWYVRRAEDWS